MKNKWPDRAKEKCKEGVMGFEFDDNGILKVIGGACKAKDLRRRKWNKPNANTATIL